MAEATVILAETPDNPGLDYAFLKEEGTRIVQELAGKIWTDYNEHDPGVTTLEQLCYALTELSYRAEFPLVDLLTDQAGHIDPNRQALFVGQRIFPCNPLTIDDFRKLLVDRVSQLANIWLQPCSEEVGGQQVNGLYKLLLYIPTPADPCAEETEQTPEGIVSEVAKQYVAHRTLCEDLAEAPIVLKPVPTTIAVDVSIGDRLSPEEIMAGILFNVGNYLAPELRRRPLTQTMVDTLAPSAIFNGPLMLHGLINDDELQDYQQTVYTQDILRAVINTEGVLTAKHLKVCVQGSDAPYGGLEQGENCPIDPNIPIEVPDNSVLQLVTDLSARCNGAGIRLLRQGVVVNPNAARVQRLLQRRWAEYRRSYDLAAQYREYYPFPKGEYRDVKSYYSIQNQYPKVYGIGSYGLPHDVTAMRKAQAKQLKGYLLVFEQMLADYFSQLAHVKDLFSTAQERPQTYYFQYLNQSVPDVEPLLKQGGDGQPGYRKGLPKVVASQDPAMQRRNQFMDFLLALYGESLDSANVSQYSCREHGEPDEQRLLKAKRALLEHLVESSYYRGRGIDYYDLSTGSGFAGMAIKSRIQLGMNVFLHRPLMDVLDECALSLADSDDEAMNASSMSLARHQEHIESQFAPLNSFDNLPKPSVERGRQLLQQLPLMRRNEVSEQLIEAASELQNYRIGSVNDGEEVTIVCYSSRKNEWLLVGRLSCLEDAVHCIHELLALAQLLYRHCQQLYVVEHVLLRYSHAHEADEGSESLADTVKAIESDAGPALQNGHHDHHRHHEFDYNFTITVVVSTCMKLRFDRAYRLFVEEVLRQNAPAHIKVETCFISPARMGRFEHLYWTWRRAMRNGQRHERARTSTRLRHFLQHHHHRHSSSE